MDGQGPASDTVLPSEVMDSSSLRWRRYLFAVMALRFMMFAGILLVLHGLNFSLSYDSAINLQRFWLMTHGGFASSINAGSVFSDHSLFCTLFYLPVYMLFPGYAGMMLLQIGILTASAFPVYLLARKHLGENLGVGLAISYLFYPALGFGAVGEFHPEMLVVLVFAWAVWFYDSAQWPRFFLCCALALLCKENMSGVVFSFGMLALLHRRAWRWSAVPMFMGLLWLGLHLRVFSPFFNRGEGISYWSFYAHLGRTPGAIAAFVLRHPLQVLHMMFLQEDVPALMGQLLFPLLFLCLVKPAMALPVACLFVQHLLSRHATEHVIHYHYYAVVAPFLYASSILALKWVFQKIDPDIHARAVFAWVFVVVAFFCTLLYGPMGKTFVLWRASPEDQFAKSRYQRERLRALPRMDGVCAHTDNLRHVCERRHVYFLGDAIAGKYSYSTKAFRQWRQIAWMETDLSTQAIPEDSPLPNILAHERWYIHAAWGDWLLLGRAKNATPLLRELDVTDLMHSKSLFHGRELELRRASAAAIIQHGVDMIRLDLAWMRTGNVLPPHGVVLDLEVESHGTGRRRRFRHRVGYGVLAADDAPLLFQERCWLPVPGLRGGWSVWVVLGRDAMLELARSG